MAATDESTPPESPQMTFRSPTWALIAATCSATTEAGFHCSIAAGDFAQEPGQDFGSVRGVDDLGMELDAVELPVVVLERGDR